MLVLKLETSFFDQQASQEVFRLASAIGAISMALLRSGNARYVIVTKQASNVQKLQHPLNLDIHIKIQLKQGSGLYKLSCYDCPEFYIGQT